MIFLDVFILLMAICAPLIVIIFLGMWGYGFINALRFYKYRKEIKELAAAQNIILPIYMEDNIYTKVSSGREVNVFYLNWLSTASEKDTIKSLKDKKKLLKFYNGGRRKIKKIIFIFIGYVIITSVAVLIKLNL
jgi:hypothetical protein